jgi:hypothetical protein
MMKWNWNIVVVILGAGLLGLLFSLFKLRFI